MDDSGEDWEADNESNMEVDNDMDDPETIEQRNVSATPTVPALIRPTWRIKNTAEKVLVMVDTMEPRRNKVIKTT